MPTGLDFSFLFTCSLHRLNKEQNQQARPLCMLLPHRRSHVASAPGLYSADAHMALQPHSFELLCLVEGRAA